jgi:hypothetical protein
MDKWRGLNGPITAEMAEAEPESERLFNRPPRNPGVLPETIDTRKVRRSMKKQKGI